MSDGSALTADFPSQQGIGQGRRVQPSNDFVEFLKAEVEQSIPLDSSNKSPSIPTALP